MHNTLIIPDDVIASWPVPNYINPETQGDRFLYTCIILGSISLVVVALRLHSRLFVIRSAGIDDLLAGFALIITIALSVFAVITQKYYGVGKHIWDVPLDDFSNERFYLWISAWCYYFASLTIKTSVLLFYRRLSISFSKTFKIAIWAGIVFNVLYTAGALVTISLNCRPIQAYWLAFKPSWASTHSFRCGDESVNLVVSVSLSMVSDIYSTLLPIILILSTDLPKTNTFPLYALFGVGFFVVGAGIARAVILADMVTNTYDFTWHIYEFWMWTVIELYVAIIAASMPALKAWVTKWAVPGIATTVGRSSKGASQLSTNSSADSKLTRRRKSKTTKIHSLNQQHQHQHQHDDEHEDEKEAASRVRVRQLSNFMVDMEMGEEDKKQPALSTGVEATTTARGAGKKAARETL